jgi:cellulose synthase operon protein C
MVPRRMAKSSVERYEQLLAQDPASAVFVELAKALIAKGELAQAMAVCEQGILHHPQSVTGRVLWGKALILMGRPAEAMSQFDQAVATDKENPHAYNLISEVLLQRGLYRSALPILRKALALQPNDARVRGWMEQAQAALAGGPAPAFEDLNSLEKPGPEEGASAPDAPPAPPPEALAEPVSPAAEPVQPLVQPLSAEPRVTEVASPPFTLDALPEVALPFDDEDLPLSITGEDEPPAVELSPEGEGGLLEDLPPPLEAVPAPPPEPEPAVSAAAPEPGLEAAEAPEAAEDEGRRDLLEGLPEVAAPAARPPAPTAAPAAPQAPVPDLAAQAAAYERELRATLMPKMSGGFPSSRAVKVLAAVSAGVVLLGGGLVLKVRQGGQALSSTLDRTAQLLRKDTEGARQDALALLSHVVSLEEDNTRAWAQIAYAEARRATEGLDAEARPRALAALAHPGVREAQPGLALAVDALLADAPGREAASRALVGAKLESAEAQSLAGELLLARGQTKQALERFTRALELAPRDVRSRVALGDYYRDADDPVNALRLYASATKLVPDHPGARLGVAESRLMLGQDLEQALSDVQALESQPALPPSARERQRLVRARLLVALGKAREARALLADPGKGPLALELLVARGEAERASGDMAAAQRSFEEARKLAPDNDEAKVGLGRVLLARGHEREVLSRLEGSERPVALVRAAAYARLGDWKRARVELAHTRVDSRYPAEAIVYLARADAADGERARAQEALEKTLVGAHQDKSQVRLALGLLHWQDKSLDKASGLLETAVAEDPRNDAAALALGQLRLAQGLPDMALQPLSQAIERNGSNTEARETLGRTLLNLGRADEAQRQFEAWRTEDPGAGAAHKGLALVLLHAGKPKDAEAAAAQAVKLSASDPEAWRTRAEALFALGDTRGGFGALESANRLDSKAPETFCAIAAAFLRQGLVVNADKAYEAARRESPDSLCGQVGAHWVKDSGGAPAAQALRDLSQKASTPWDKAFTQAALARVLLASGGLKDARAAADEAVRLAPFSGRAQLALGQVSLRQKDEPGAERALVRATQLEPVDGLVWLALADALAHQPAQTERAVQAYQTFLKLAAGSPEAGRVKKALPALLRKTGGK